MRINLVPILASIFIVNCLACISSYACDRIEPFMKSLPSSRSDAAYSAFFEFVDGKCNTLLEKELKQLPLSKQYEKLQEFYQQILVPIKKNLIDSNTYVPYYYSIESRVLEKLCEVKFLLATDAVIDSSPAFDQAIERFGYLSGSQKKQHPARIQKLLTASLCHGNFKQIIDISACVPLTLKQSDEISNALCKCMNACTIDKQLSMVHELLKKSDNLAQYITQTRHDQGSAAWSLNLKAHLVKNKSKKAFNLFKLDDGTVADQLFMHTVIPFLSVQKKESQKVVAQLLEIWTHSECKESHKYTHERCEQIFELTSNNTPFKKTFESGQNCGAYVLLWLARMRIRMWSAREKKPLLHARFRNEQLALLNKAEEFFAQIPSDAAKILGQEDNDKRLSQHGTLLCELLLDRSISQKKVGELCVGALKSGLNLVDKKYITSIATSIKSDAFLKIIEPYLVSNPNIVYGLGVVYSAGCMENGRLFWWLAPDKNKATSLVKQAFDAGYMEAFLPLVTSAKDFQEAEQFCSEARVRFPDNYALKIKQAIALRAIALTPPQEPQKKLWAHKAMQLVEGLEHYTPHLSHKDLVCYSALKTSCESIKYGANNSGENEEKKIKALASMVQATYHASLHPKNPLFDVATTFFDESVFDNLKTYTQRILKKNTATVTYQDLSIMSLCGYMLYRTYDDAAISHDDKLLLDAIIDFGLCDDNYKKTPPLMHVLAFTRLLKNKTNAGLELFYSHMVNALQQGVSKDKVDHVARHEAEQPLNRLASDGATKAQMILTMYNKDGIQDYIPTLHRLTEKIFAIKKENISMHIQWINECGAYALLKESLLNRSCTHCRLSIANILLAWIGGLVHNGDKADPQLAPFFKDITLITAYVKG